jgi:hypothetical protein
MQEFKREYPLFALCGLNCGLCPRFHTDGPSRCPGCGGENFRDKHPSCVVITCNKKRDNVEYCFQCSSFPCARYAAAGEADSFITYRNVLRDFDKAKKRGIEAYKKELNEKTAFLRQLLGSYDDGRRKGFYCLAVNLIELPSLRKIREEIEKSIAGKEPDAKLRADRVVDLFQSAASDANIQLKLRK